MRCWRAQARLSDWIDGALQPSVAARVEQHLAGCTCCRRLARELRRVVELVATDESWPDTAPRCTPSALFARVTAALSTPPGAVAKWLAAVRGWFGTRWTPGGRARWQFGAAAAALCGVAGAALIWQHGTGLDPFSDSGRSAQSGATIDPQRTHKGDAVSDLALLQSARREFARAERHYRQAIQQLRRIAAEDGDGWSPRRRRSYAADLALFEEAVAGVRHAARLAPADPSTQELLFAAYRRQIRFMQRAVLRPARGNDDRLDRGPGERPE